VQTQISKYPTTFYRVSLKAVIRNAKGEVLLAKEDEGDNWSLPGGGWDHGETEREALARELFEEVSYRGDFSATPFATEIFWLDHRKAWLLWIVYDVTVENYDFAVGRDCTAVAFHDPKVFRDSPHTTEQWVYTHLNH